MIIFREGHAASSGNRDLKEQLKTRQLHLSEANLENEKLNEEMRLQSKLIKQMEETVQHLEQEKESLEEKVYNLEILLHVKMRNYIFEILQYHFSLHVSDY